LPIEPAGPRTWRTFPSLSGRMTWAFALFWLRGVEGICAAGVVVVVVEVGSAVGSAVVVDVVVAGGFFSAGIVLSTGRNLSSAVVPTIFNAFC